MALKGTGVQGKLLQLDCLDYCSQTLKELSLNSDSVGGRVGFSFGLKQLLMPPFVTLILKLLRGVKNMLPNPVASLLIEQRRPVKVASSRKSLAPNHYNPLLHAGLNIQNLLLV